MYRPVVGVEHSSLLLENRNPAETGEVFIDDDASPFTSNKGLQFHSEFLPFETGKCPELIFRAPHDESALTQREIFRNDHDRKEAMFGDAESGHGFMLNSTDGSARKSADCNPSNYSDQGNMKIRSSKQGILGTSTSKGQSP